MDGKNRRYAVDAQTAHQGVTPIYDLDRSNMMHPSEIGYYDETDSNGVDFWSLARILFMRKWMILAITIAGVAASFALTLRVTPLYGANASIEVQREEVQIIEGTNVGPDLVADDTYMETQYRLLRSRFLAERVAEDLDLPNDPRYANADHPRDIRVLQAASTIVGGLRVSPAGNSRVVNVGFVSPYPQEAARISNAIVEAFIQSNLERKYNTTSFAREFLDERLAATKRTLEESERKLVQYAEMQGLLDIGVATSGSLDENSIVALNNELSNAESDRIRAEQEYRTALETPEFHELLQNQMLIRLRDSRSTLMADYQEMLGRFKPDYPDMVRLQTRIETIEQQIERETSAMINNLRVDYEASVAREASLRSRVDELRVNLQDERSRRIQYKILQREVETVRSQYEALLQRSKEVSIAAGIGSSNISVVDEALVPMVPFEPNLPRAMIQGFILSLALSVGLAFALNFVDNTIKTPEDVRTKLGLAAISIVPKVQNKKDSIVKALDDPKSQISEAFSSARTALEFATEAGTPRSLLVTSTRPEEGKTATTISLATTFAKGGEKVLIIDGDMRKPSFVIDSRKSIGLSGLLTGYEAIQDHIVESKTPGLFILPAGIVPPNPAQLLSGPRLREIVDAAEQLYDVVIIDSPPVLSFTDSPRLGSVVKGALVVIQSGLIRTPAAQRTVSQLYSSRTNVLGAVLTKFDAKKAGYEYSFYYSTYGIDAYAYVESNNRALANRNILIETADVDDTQETERWASDH